MVTTISALVEGNRGRWAICASLMTAGSITGGTAIGLAFGILGRVISMRIPLPLAVLVLLLLVGAVLDLGLLPIRLPSRGSVPKKWWIAHGPVKASAMYGLVLGLGVTTFVPFATFYSLLVSAAYLGPIPGLLVGAAYGLGRAVPVWVASIAIAGGRRPMATAEWILGEPKALASRAIGLLAVAVTGVVGIAALSGS